MAKSLKQIEMDRYSEEVTAFQEVDSEEASKLLEQEGTILYIGRESCGFCRKFVHKLSPLAVEEDLTVYYLHALQEDDQEGIDQLREQYEVPTVPGLLYASKNEGVIVKCDSSLSPEEILDIVEAN